MPRVELQPSSMCVPSAPYVPGTKRGRFVFTSGQVAFDGQGNLVGKGDVAAQTRRALENVEAVLREGGAALSDVMKVTVFLKDAQDFRAMNQVYAAVFKEIKPARSTVQALLMGPDLLVEIEAVAMVKGED